MPFADDLSLFKQRLGANAPHLALDQTSTLMAVATALLSANADTAYLITQSAANMFVASASGSALAAKVADLGVLVGTGVTAQGSVLFTVQQPAPATITIPIGTLVATAGDNISVLSQQFATTAATTIPQGATSSGSSQVETVTISGAPTGGTFTLTHAGQTTSALAYNASAATVQSALQALSNVGTNSVTTVSNVAVTGNAGGPYTVTWQGALAGVTFAAMTATAALTGGTSPGVSIALTTAVAGTGVTAVTAGAAGNVAANTITQMVTAISGVNVTNPSAAIGGVDPDTDAALRAKAFAVLAPKYGASAVQAAVLAVSGVWDAYVYDPQNGSGTITVFWCDVNGATPGLTGTTPGSLTVNGVIAGNTLASSVQQAVLAVLPPNITVIWSSFVINNLTAVAATYSAPTAVSTTTIGPQIQTAIAAYVQSLLHNQVPTSFGMASAVQTAVGFSLLNFTLTSTSPVIGSASNSAIYRLTGTPSAVITLTRA